MAYGNCIDCTYCRCRGETAYDWFNKHLVSFREEHKEEILARDYRVSEINLEIAKIESSIDDDDSITATTEDGIYRKKQIKKEIATESLVDEKERLLMDYDIHSLEVHEFECTRKPCKTKLRSAESGCPVLRFPVIYADMVEERTVGCGEFYPVYDLHGPKKRNEGQ